VTGNAGGRPKSMAPAILDRCPTVSEDLVDFWTLVAFGSASAVKRRYGVDVQAHALLRNPQIAKLMMGRSSRL
jgi:hypothetical protein